MTDETIRDRAKKEHERLMGEDPKYRKNYEEFSRIMDSLFESKTMTWVKAEEVTPELGHMYLVWTNGDEWDDNFVHLWPAPMLQHYLKPEVVRGRPLFVAKVIAPQ